MPRDLTVAPHLSVVDLATRYRIATDPVARRHWQLVWRVAQGMRVPVAARQVGYSAAWAREIVHRYNAAGPTGLEDRRHHNAGHPPLLTAALRAELAAALRGPAPSGGSWTSATVAAWMATRLGRPVAPARGWEALKALGFTPHRRR